MRESLSAHSLLSSFAAPLWVIRRAVVDAHSARSHGPGNVLLATIESENVTEVFTGFGERGVLAERVADGVANETTRYLANGVPVGEHLADQLLLPLALGVGGCFRTTTPSGHTRTQSGIIQSFLGTKVELKEESPDVWQVDVRN